MWNSHCVIAVFKSHQKTDEATRKLLSYGFDMQTLSVIGLNNHPNEQVAGYYNSTEGMKLWGECGGFWNGLWDILSGSGYFELPSIGSVVVAGPLAMLIIAGLEAAPASNTVIPLDVAFSKLGIPEHNVEQYVAEVKNGKYLLIVHGTSADGDKARECLYSAESSVHAAANDDSENPTVLGDWYWM